MTWACPSCGQEWPEKPLVDGTIGCPSCGNVAERDLDENDLTLPEWAHAPHHSLGFSTRQVQVQELLAERDTLREQRDQLEADRDGWAKSYAWAEARVEALQQALRDILGPGDSQGPLADWEIRNIARAALTRSGGQQ